jgi:hypothetical protein
MIGVSFEDGIEFGKYEKCTIGRKNVKVFDWYIFRLKFKPFKLVLFRIFNFEKVYDCFWIDLSYGTNSKFGKKMIKLYARKTSKTLHN